MSVGFSESPTGGDTAVRVHAAAAADYAPGAKYHIYIIDGESTTTRNHLNETMIRLFAGEELTDTGIQLNESNPAVPLSDGQQITVLTKNLDEDTVASRFTYTVGEHASRSQETTPATTSTHSPGTTADTQTTQPATETTQAATRTTGGDRAAETTTHTTPTDAGTTSGDAAGFGLISTLVGVTAASLTNRLRSNSGD